MKLTIFHLILQTVVCMASNETFMYFGYGSNLLAKRIHLQNPTAVFRGVGELKDHRLDFFEISGRWGGGTATIVPDVNNTVWGDIWEIDMKNSADLDDQEAVHLNIYFSKIVDIHKVDGEVVKCRTYQKVVNPPDNVDSYPAQKPSKIYLHVIIQGAIESGLPDFYVQKLKNIPHNNYYDNEIRDELNLTELDI